MCVVGDNCLVILDQNRPVNVYSYDPKCGHKGAQIVDATVGYQDPQSVQKSILMINQAICINGLENYLLCWMQCHPNGVHISKVPKFLTESPSVSTHAIKVTDPFATSHPLIFLFQFSGVTNYFDLHSLNITEYKNEDIGKIHLTAKEPSWNPSTNKY